QILERPPAPAELVARHRAAAEEAPAAREGVVDDEPDLDERSAALAARSLPVAQEPQRGAEHAREGGEDRDGRLQGAHVVRGRLQQSVAFGDGLVDETELAVLEIADAAVDHVRRGGRGAAGGIA